MADFGVFSVVSPGLTAVFTMLLGLNSVSTLDVATSPAPQPVVIEETQPVAVEEPTATKTYMSKDEYDAVLKNAPIEGSKKAKFTLIEYSDFECPFCIRQYKDGTIAKVQKKYGSQVNHIFRPVNLVRHLGADEKALSALCVAQVAGTKKYSRFYRAILAGSESGWAVFPIEKMKSLTKRIGVNQTQYMSCVEQNTTRELYASFAAEMTKFKIEGTPGTMIINNETREYTLVIGAYDAERFITAIESIQ